MLDDIKNTCQLGELALAYFDGGKDGTCTREMKPRTCPLVTLNWEALDGLFQDYRYANEQDLLASLKLKTISYIGMLHCVRPT